MRQSPNKFIDRGKEALAVGASAALFATLGAVAAKASTTSEKGAIKSNAPHLISSGLRPERSQDLPILRPFKAGEGMSFEQFNFTRHLLDRFNTGPANENIIDNGGMRLMPGTIIYKAPMEGAVDHVIDKKHVEFWYFMRLMLVRGKLWAAARNVMDKTNHFDEALDVDWATDPRYYDWVKVSQAKNSPGYEHLVPIYSRSEPTSTGVWKNPPLVYQIRPNDQSNIMINQPHPNTLSDPRYLANFYKYDIKYKRPDGGEDGKGGVSFVPTKRPVQFVKAKIPIQKSGK